jgi:hypothetical protein
LVASQSGAASRISAADRLKAITSAASSEFTSARRIEMVFMSTPPSWVGQRILSPGYQFLQKDYHLYW